MFTIGTVICGKSGEVYVAAGDEFGSFLGGEYNSGVTATVSAVSSPFEPLHHFDRAVQRDAVRLGKVSSLCCNWVSICCIVSEL